MKLYFAILLLVFMKGSSWATPFVAQAFPQERQQLDAGLGEWKTLDGRPTVLFAHRGEKVILPEHTIPGYEAASILGADYVEPDLCLTKDDVFVCHHDITLRQTTDVASHPELDHLKKTLNDGTVDWYIRDLTLAQLKTLRIVQENTGIRLQDFNGLFAIPTFQEYLDVIHSMTYRLNRTIGIVPELKEPAFHNKNRSANFIEKQIMEVLSNNGYPIFDLSQKGHCTAKLDVKGGAQKSSVAIACPPVIIQSFELPPLEFLKKQTELNLMMLVDEDATLLTIQGMKKLASLGIQYYSTWKEYLFVGVEKDMTFNNLTWDKDLIASMGGFIPAEEFTPLAHQLGLKIVLYTFHDSREPSLRGCATGCKQDTKTMELDYYFNMGVDGMFIENVAESIQIRKNYECGLEKQRLIAKQQKGPGNI